MSINKAVTALVLAGSFAQLAACSSQETKEADFKEEFATTISENGSKMFTFTLSSNHSNSPDHMSHKGSMGRKGGGNRSAGTRGNRDTAGSPKGAQDVGSRQTQIQATLNERLAAKLAETGYCREGYFEIDSYVTPGFGQIKGECNETATLEDREEFLQASSNP